MSFYLNHFFTFLFLKSQNKGGKQFSVLKGCKAVTTIRKYNLKGISTPEVGYSTEFLTFTEHSHMMGSS